MSICEMVKTLKWYYICNMRSAYIPINRRYIYIQREREGGREREHISLERGGYVHSWNGENTESVPSL